MFVKTYADGSVLVIDRSDSPAERQLELRRDHGSAVFTLPYQGVRTLGPDFTGEDVAEYTALPLTVDALYMDRDNLYRCEFYDQDRCTIQVAEPVRVQIHVRQYPKPETVLLDGNELALEQPCGKLINCFDSLYLSTQELILSPGEHILCTDAAESMHLPAVVLSGSFVYDRNGLRKNAFLVDSIPFFGRLTAKVTFSVPENARESYISLGDQPWVAQLELDGRIVSESMASYGRLAIPADCKGKTVSALVHVYSSLSPIFGDVAAADNRLNMRVWWVKNCAASQPEILDVRKLQLHYR